MKITSRVLAWVCVVLLFMHPVVAVAAWFFMGSDDDYGLLASVLAVGAGTALLARLIFGLPGVRGHAPGAVRLGSLLIGVVAGLASAICWVLDEVNHVWLAAGVALSVLFILFVLAWFVDRVNEERTGQGGGR